MGGRICKELALNGIKKLLDYNITHILDANGAEVGAYEYDAWGNILSVSGGEIAGLNPYRYRGYRFDAETGLYYLQSRDYNPVWGRFINGDVLVGTGQMANMFAYCFNNPVNQTDTTGMVPDWMIPTVMADGIGNFTLTKPRWWNRVPRSDWTCPSTNQIIGNATGTLAGSDVGGVLSKVKVNKNFYSDSTNYIRYAPGKGLPNARYPGLKTTGKLSLPIALSLTGLNVTNTWTENNYNTNGDRVVKSGIQIAGLGGGILVGITAVGVANAWNPAGWGILAGIGVAVAGTYAIDWAQNKAYDHLGID